MRAGSFLFPPAIGLAVVLSFLIYMPGAYAETIEIRFTGLDLVYDTPRIFDAGGDAGGANNPGQSDPLTSVMFMADSDVQWDTTEIFGDILMENVLEIPVGGGQDESNNVTPFGFHVFSTFKGWNVNLNLDTLKVSYSGFGITIAADGKASGIADQDLSPLGLENIDTSKDIKISFTSSSLTDVTDNGTYLTSFKASGTGSITATLVPEPSTLVGLFMGALGLTAYAWLRRRR